MPYHHTNHDVLLIGMVHTLARSIVDLLTDSVEDGGGGVGGRKKVGGEGEEETQGRFRTMVIFPCSLRLLIQMLYLPPVSTSYPSPVNPLLHPLILCPNLCRDIHSRVASFTVVCSCHALD